MFRSAIILSALLLAGCSEMDRPLRGIDRAPMSMGGGGTRILQELMGERATVLVSLDAECPITGLYGPLLDSLARVSVPQGIAFIGFHPTAGVPAEHMATFLNDVVPGLVHVLDTSCTLAHALDCRILPEVFVLDAQGTLRYHGAIDDRAVRPGRKKLQATHHYLVDALNALSAGADVEVLKVPAVGCFVECANI